MKPILVFSQMVMQSNTFVRFACDNVPNILIGDTFLLPLMTTKEAAEFGFATLKKRHWQGGQLVLSCAVSEALLKYLVKIATKAEGHHFIFNLPDQDWLQQHEDTSTDFIEDRRYMF
ncbi:MAG: hypothetical protein KBC41_03525 [Candidatus Pacebacteria bacterium]|nr:hypothetical protein [Candidatus Paceibacterota bacterium]